MYGWSYAQSGHFFIGWTLPTTAIVFDTTTGIWAERASRYIDENDDTIDITYRAACFVQAYGNLYVGIPRTGNRPAVHGHLHGVWEAVHRVMSTQPFQNNMQPYFVPYLELTMESGVGNASEPDPMIIMDRSLNGGKSFTYVRERPIGKEGGIQPPGDLAQAGTGIAVRRVPFHPVRTRKTGHYRADGPAGGVENAQA